MTYYYYSLTDKTDFENLLNKFEKNKSGSISVIIERITLKNSKKETFVALSEQNEEVQKSTITRTKKISTSNYGTNQRKINKTNKISKRKG